MSRTFRLELVGPRRHFYSGPAQELIFGSVDGSYGVLAGHEPTLAPLVEGLLRFKVDDQWTEVITSDGFVEIMPDYVTVVTMSILRPDEVDMVRAQQARERAEEKLRLQKGRQEYIQSQAALARALARLKYGSRKVRQ